MLDRVTDTKNHTPKQGIKEAEQRLDKAQDALREAFFEAVDAAMDFGWLNGWDDGFDVGWDAAFDSLKENETQLKTTAKGGRSTPPPRAPRSPSTMMRAGRQQLTAQEIVLLFINEYPGARGVDIANNFATGSNPIPERTVRTALHRLKAAEQIKNIDGKWYVAEWPESRPTVTRR